MIEKERIKKEFREYASGYDLSDIKIKLKADHTYRVAALAERIARSAGADTDLAWACGMLHDIGRFEQVRVYNTFLDGQSVDHARFGADLLFRDGLIDRFGDFTEHEKQIIETSIRNHNRYLIDDQVEEPVRTYCKVLRDADKVDIFRVNWETPQEELYNVSTAELKASPVAEAVKQCYLERHTVLGTLRKYPIDHLTGQICLVFGLEYPVSLRLAREQGYVDRLLQFESENKETAEWFAFMRRTLWPMAEGIEND